MRAAIAQRLLTDPGVQAVVGARVFQRQGPYGGISRDETPEAFDADGDVLPSLVVQMEVRSVRPDRPGRAAIAANQVIAVFALAQRGYTAQEDALRAVTASLDGLQGLRPINDVHVRCAEVRWSEDTGALLDPALDVPMLASRFVAAITFTPSPGG